MASKRRGRPSNRRLPAAIRAQAIEHIRTQYPDFGPTFASEKLAEHHDICVSVETLRTWMIESGIWVPRAQRQRVHQPRRRRECLGELLQIDGQSSNVSAPYFALMNSVGVPRSLSVFGLGVRKDAVKKRAC